MKSTKAYIIRCQRQPRCGSGQVLLRMTHKVAVIAAKTHAKRRGHVTKVYPVPRPFDDYEGTYIGIG